MGNINADARCQVLVVYKLAGIDGDENRRDGSDQIAGCRSKDVPVPTRQRLSSFAEVDLSGKLRSRQSLVACLVTLQDPIALEMAHSRQGPGSCTLPLASSAVQGGCLGTPERVLVSPEAASESSKRSPRRQVSAWTGQLRAVDWGAGALEICLNSCQGSVIPGKDRPWQCSAPARSGHQEHHIRDPCNCLAKSLVKPL